MIATPRLLVVNSNTDPETTARVAAVVCELAPEAEVTAVNAAFGPHGIGGRADIVISGMATLEAAAGHAADHDAVIVACFSDPGLHALRELLEIPVVGIGEASFLTAAMLGARFSVVTPGERIVPVMEEAVRLAGLWSRFAGVTLIPSEALGAAEPLPILTEGVERAVARQGAEVIVLGGAAFAGLATPLMALSPVPVVGSVEAATVQALGLCRLSPRKAGTGSYSMPARKRMHKLSAVLADRLGLARP